MFKLFCFALQISNLTIDVLSSKFDYNTIAFCYIFIFDLETIGCHEF